MKLLILAVFACIICFCAGAKSIGDMKKCMDDAKNKCVDSCEDKVAEKFRKPARKCLDAFHDKMGSSIKTCMIGKGYKESMDCFVPPGMNAKGGEHKEPAFMAKFDAEFPELVEAKTCVKKCIMSSMAPCTEGCTAKADTEVLGALRKCKFQSGFATDFQTMKSCLHTALGTTAPSN